MAKVLVFSISSIDLDVLESSPPQLSITVAGMVTSSGWTGAELIALEDSLSPDGILDLEFVAEPPPPGTIVLPALRPVAASLIWKDEVERLIGVKVTCRTSTEFELLAEINVAPPIRRASISGGTTRMGSAVGFDPRPGGFPSTDAIGEENGPITSLAIGEEGGPITTLAVGEEGDPRKPFFGETDPRIDDPKPWFGEGGPTPFPDPRPWPFPFPVPKPFGRRG